MVRQLFLKILHAEDVGLSGFRAARIIVERYGITRGLGVANASTGNPTKLVEVK